MKRMLRVVTRPEIIAEGAQGGICLAPCASPQRRCRMNSPHCTSKHATRSRQVRACVVLVAAALVVAGSQVVMHQAANPLAMTRKGYTRFLEARGAEVSPLPEAVLQHALNDCGVAVLEALLRARRTPHIPGRDSLTRLVGLTARGTTLGQLGRSLVALGVEHRRMVRHAPIAGMSPFIAHMKYRHFVLVLSAGERRVRLFDPLVGSVTMDTHEFRTLWSGGGLQVLPPGHDNQSSRRRLICGSDT